MSYKPTSAQQQVIDADDPVLLVTGGVGTGKTTTTAAEVHASLEHRLEPDPDAPARCMPTGGAPRRALFLSFSRAAVAQILDRTADILGPCQDQVEITTYHAFAWSLIERLDDYQQRFLPRVAPDVAEAVRLALAGRIDGQPRRSLARQIVLLALRLVLVPPGPVPAADANLTAGLANLDPETAAVLLAHLAADTIAQQHQDNEPRFGGTAESLAMEVIVSHLFNERDDPGDLLARYRLLWTRYGDQLKRVHLRRRPVELLEEATGLDFDDLTALGFGYYAAALAYRLDTPVAVNAFANIAIGRPVIEQFLGLFSSIAEELGEALRDCVLPWQMLPLAERPLLRAGDNAVVLDERYLLDRVTRGLYWPVHDQEKQLAEQARVLWTQAYGEMIESRAEDQLRQLAPPAGRLDRKHVLHRRGPPARSRLPRTPTLASTSEQTLCWWR